MPIHVDQHKTDDLSPDPFYGRGRDAVASSIAVNRVHRVVRERAKTMKARRSRIRSLWIPFAIFSSLLIAFCASVWTALDEYEIAASGSQIGGYQILVPLVWSIPVSAALLAVVWFRQSRVVDDANSRLDRY